MDWRVQATLGAAAVLALLLGWAIIARMIAPQSNTSRSRFDAILVLGTSADMDGNPTPDQLSRVTEAVHEYQRGVAPRLILSGGAVANRFVEAEVMARTAEAEGIPASAIVLEPHARDTMQNACFAERIMLQRGWRSAEVISTPSHLPRAAMILDRLPLEWSVHPAPPLAPESAAYQRGAATVETLKTLRYLLWARWTEHCTP